MIGIGMGLLPADFIVDRGQQIEGGIDDDFARRTVPSRIDEMRAKLTLLDEQLADGRPFLLGNQPSLADFSVYPPLWSVQNFPQTPIEQLRAVPAWMERVAAFGHGMHSELEAGEAIAVARAARSTTEPFINAGEPNDRHVGDRLAIFPEPYGREPVIGELVYADAQEIALRRTDERAGEVVVHFPREGFIVLPA